MTRLHTKLLFYGFYAEDEKELQSVIERLATECPPSPGRGLPERNCPSLLWRGS